MEITVPKEERYLRLGSSGIAIAVIKFNVSTNYDIK
jgi:hypothetical protein